MRYVCCSLGTLKNGINLFEDIRKHLNQTQLFPKLYHPGKVYQLRRIKTMRKGRMISLLFYKIVGLEYYENLLIVKHSLKHHMINHISKVLKECSKDFNELEKKK
ncbi:hypothetical protein NBO_401gi002 [Nosema bombycis CQ1]|uniref:Uncharacterized protein n=1 Tax=Nosema bombycis (strain CQ1 / CVCC 102059) TaxID=578461 RepID=R0MIG6_NOSB1|nr:hypothetical protein NBO_401gi002 [Nosema bombycis CQ1]|eukprot:EOB12598.1 hypothetical protein NBO_401gi002 [Nosema bombycis CQ1]